MKKHIIYLATDANRTNIDIGYCNNIVDQLPYHTKSNRIVYMEEFLSFEEAQKRQFAFHTYTRMMKERLIRKSNPNWLNIGITVDISMLAVHKKSLPTFFKHRQRP